MAVTTTTGTSVQVRRRRSAAAVGDQAGRQVEQHAGLALAALGLVAPALAGRHQQADAHGDQQVDAERQVVLRVIDDDVVVGLEEQPVEGEEAEAGGGDARPEATGRHRRVTTSR
jgi:hypothetical protein